VLRSYLPALVFLVLGGVVGAAFTALNSFIGPRRAARDKQEPYECGLPSEVKREMRFGISFYLIAMLFILFDIEVVFLYPVGSIVKDAGSVFVLGDEFTPDGCRLWDKKTQEKLDKDRFRQDLGGEVEAIEIAHIGEVSDLHSHLDAALILARDLALDQ